MGLILGSSVLIAADRQGQNARQMLSGRRRKSARRACPGLVLVTQKCTEANKRIDL
jgi:hypothetical protein